ncbi:hypothetical protein [Citricoccus sp.]|uniref:hypothetical protein n=1 Tax=Citricoccus sp. TaxID=1978372 RepID=UPI00260DBC1C|nr:hypothetical protein [Citricoccus sp.]HRO29961.1 hypothetical protein [Citricoccus sp.]HRO93271.1 hypothetical protein [Citricoccus sp.]
MFNPWENGSRAYRITLLTGTGLILSGILLSVLGGALTLTPLQWGAIGLIGAGLITHLAAQVLRIRDARRRHR